MNRLSTIASATLLPFALALACGNTTPAHSGDDPPPLDEPSGSAPSVEAPSSEAVRQAMDAIQAQDFKRAKELLEPAAAKAPKDPQAAYYLGVALEGLGDLTGAEEQYRRALGLDPKLVDAAVNLSGILLDSKQDGAGALAVVKAALGVAPKDPRLLMNRAIALELAGDKDGALGAYAEAVEANPDNVDLRLAWAELLAGAGRKDDAKSALEKVVSDDPKLMVQLAVLFGKIEAFAECVATLDKLIAKKDDAGLRVRRGVCRHGMKDEPGARADYDAAIKLDPAFVPAHYYLGQSFRGEGKKKEAMAAFARAVELDKEGKSLGKRAQQELDELKGGK